MYRLFFIAGALLCSFAAGGAQSDGGDAAQFPRRPIRFVIGFTPGGGPDITARFIGQKLAGRWHQQVVTDNRPGAGGTIASILSALVVLRMLNHLDLVSALKAPE